MKQWWKSKTIWVNFAISLLTVIEANFDFFREYNQEKYIVIVLLTTTANFWLRTITNKPIRRKRRTRNVNL